MQPITISAFGLALVFMIGFAAGWLFGRVRLQGRINIAFQQPGATPGSGSSFAVAKTVRTLSLKCQCRATWRFHETSGHSDQGSQPMPAGDTFICPNCGKSLDLREVHKLLPDAKSAG